jgi:hypothetical protein
VLAERPAHLPVLYLRELQAHELDAQFADFALQLVIAEVVRLLEEHLCL